MTRLTLAKAKTKIKKAHCRTGKVRYAYSPKRKKGTVISQSRRPGLVLVANAKINLVVSRGKTCGVPSVVGKRLGVAKSWIKRGHCRTGKVRYAYSPKRKKDVVISQSRRPGTVLRVDSRINLVVSRGRKR